MARMCLQLQVVVEAFLVGDVVVLFQGSVVAVVLPSMVIVGEADLREVSGEGDEGHSLRPCRPRALSRYRSSYISYVS